MWQWNYQMWGGKKKKRGTTEYDKSTVTCDVDIAQCEDRTIKYDTTECEKSTVKCYVKILPNVTIELSNVKKNKGTTECDKSTVTCDVNIV